MLIISAWDVVQRPGLEDRLIPHGEQQSRQCFQRPVPRRSEPSRNLLRLLPEAPCQESARQALFVSKPGKKVEDRRVCLGLSAGIEIAQLSGGELDILTGNGRLQRHCSRCSHGWSLPNEVERYGRAAARWPCMCGFRRPTRATPSHRGHRAEPCAWR